MKSLVAGYRASDRLPQERSEPAPLAIKHTGADRKVSLEGLEHEDNG